MVIRDSVGFVCVAQQTVGGGIQCFRQSFDIDEADVPFTAFNRSDVGPV